MAITAGVLALRTHTVPARLPPLLRRLVAAHGPDALHDECTAQYAVWHGARSWAGSREAWREAPARDGDYTAFFDGRLCNRDELLLSHFSAEERREPISDSRLLARAASREGSRAFRHCIGDWSVALVKHSDGAALFASDGLGLRPLYYAKTPTAVVWSTDLAIVIAAADLGPSNLDPVVLAGSIIGVAPPLKTPFIGVRAVRPGATLTVRANGEEREELWWAPWETLPQKRSTIDAGLELLALWRTIVADALPPDIPPLFELSGGFDSSSVVCMAGDLGRRQGRAIQTVTHVVPNEPAWNDLRFVKAVVDQCACVPHLLDVSLLPDDRDLSAPVPDGPHGVDGATQTLMRELGARALVTGRMGDLLMRASPFDTAAVTSAIGRLNPVEIISAATAAARASRLSAWRILRDAIQPLRPGFSRDVVSATRKRPQRKLELPVELSHLVRRELAEAARSEWRSIHEACRAARPAHRRMVAEFVHLSHRRRLEPPPGQASIFHIHPFLDRRLITFVLECPPEIMSPAGQSRALMKEAFRCLLPPAILARRSKGDAAGVVRRQFVAVAEMLLSTRRWVLADLGVIDTQAVLKGLKRFLESPVASPGDLRSIAWSEVWLRHLLYKELPPGYTQDRACATEVVRRSLRSGNTLFQQERMTA